MFQYYTQHQWPNARQEPGKDNLHDSIPFRDFQVIETSPRELVVDLPAFDQNGSRQFMFSQITTISTSAQIYVWDVWYNSRTTSYSHACA